MSAPGYIIFDLDGTLIDSSEGIIEATNYALRAMDQPERMPDEIRRFIGFPLSDMFDQFTSAPYDELACHFQTRARETVVGSTVPLDGADRVLATLRNHKFVLAIATTKIAAHIDLILEKCGWRDCFEVTVGGDQVERVKPAPDAFLRAVSLMEADPGRTLIVGDTVNDVFAARAVGLPSVAVRSPFGGEKELRQSRPEYYLDHIRALPETVDAHFKLQGESR